MIDLNIVPTQEKSETEDSLDTIVYNSPVDPIARNQIELARNDNDYMKAYYGGIPAIQMTPSVGFFEKNYVAPYRALARGTIGIGTGLVKSAVVGSQAFGQMLDDMFEENQYSSMKYDLYRRLEEGDITREQYDLGISDLEKSKKESIKFYQRHAEVEQKQTKNLLNKVDLLRYKLQELAHLNKKKGEYQILTDVVESAPTTLAAIGLAALTKSPVVAWGFMTLSQTGEMAQQQLEYGEDLYSSLLTAGVTSGASSALDVAGLEYLRGLWNAPARQFASKCKVFNRIQNWVAGKPNAKSLAASLGVSSRAAVAGATEEGVTEFAQGVIEANLPRFLGKGDKFNSLWEELSDYGYQGFLGAISGSLFGSVGTNIAYSRVHKSVVDWGKENKLSDSEARELADEVAPVIMEHHDKIMKEAVKTISEVDTSKEGIDKAAKLLTGGLTSNEKSYVRQSLLDTLNKKNPNNPTGNEIAADVLTNVVEFEASLTDGNVSKKASEINVEVYNDDTGLDISDKNYNARVKRDSGKVSVEGYVKKDLASNIIHLLNNGSPDTIIHESGHLLLKTISRVLNQTGQDAFKHPLVNAVVDLIGVPENGTEFSEQQHEAFATALQQYSKEGVAPNAALASIFRTHKRIMESFARPAIKSNELTQKGRENLASIFAMEEPELPNVDINEENVNSLLESISQIKKGQTPSIKNIKVLAELARLRRAKAPIATGYSLAEFRAEHPEYDTLTDKAKRKLLKDNQFQGADDRQTYPDDKDYIAQVERNEANVFSLENEKTRARQEYIDKYNRFKELADSLFPENQKEFLDLEIAINKLLRSGDFVITDKNFLQDVSAAMKGLLKQVQQYKKEDLQSSKQTARNLIKAVRGLLPTMDLTGIKIEGIEKVLNDLETFVLEDNLSKINEYVEQVQNRLELLVNQMVEKYIDSNYFSEQTGSRPPISSSSTVGADIDSIIGKTVAEGKPIKRNTDVVRAIRNTLRSNGVSNDIVQKIVNKLLSNEVALTTASTRKNLIDTILKEVNEEYNKKMKTKILKEWASLVSKANSKKLTHADSLFVKWVNDNIVSYELNSKAKKSIKTSLPIYYEQYNLDNIVLGKDPTLPEGQQEIKMSEEQKAFVNDMMNFMLAKDAGYDNTPYQYFETFKSINKLSYLTGDFMKRQEMAKREKLRQATIGAIEKVKGRKDIPVLGTIDNFFFTSGLSGLRSNLIKVFGQEFADLMDVIVEEDLQHTAKSKIFERLNKTITDVTKGNPNNYLAKLNAEKPFANAKEGTVQYLLKDYTYGQILSIWITSKNDIGNEWVKTEFKDKTDSVLKVIDKRLRRDDIAVAKKMMEELEALYPDLNRVYFQINGMNMGRLQKYWPVVTEYVSEGQTLRTDLNVFQNVPKERKEESFQKHRFGPNSSELEGVSRKPVWENPIEVFRRYVDTATNYIYVVPRLNELSQILNGNTSESLELQTLIKEKFGDKTLQALRDDIRFLMGLNKKERLSSLEKVLNEVVSNAVVAKLGLKIMAGVKQIPAAANFMQLMPPAAYLSYTKKAFENPKATWKYMMKKDAVRYRFQGEDLPMFFGNDRSLIIDSMLGSSDVARQLLGEKKLVQTSSFLSKLKSKALLNIKLGDITAVIYGGYAYEMYLRDKIKTDPEFANYSEAEIENYINSQLVAAIQTTQQSGYRTVQGSWQQNKGGMGSVLMRSLLTFSSFQAQQVRKVREAAYEYRNGKISKEQLLKVIGVNFFIQPTLYSVLTSPALYLSILGGMLGLDWGDEDWEDNLYLALIRPYIDNVAGAGGNLGNVLTSLTDVFAETIGQNTYGSDGDLTPFFYKDIFKALKKIKSKDVSLEDIFAPGVLAGEDVLGLPLQTLTKMLKGIWQTGQGVISEEDRNRLLYGFANIIGMSEKQFKRLLKDSSK